MDAAIQKGTINYRDNELLTDKAKAIMTCFLASEFSPRVQASTTTSARICIHAFRHYHVRTHTSAYSLTAHAHAHFISKSSGHAIFYQRREASIIPSVCSHFADRIIVARRTVTYNGIQILIVWLMLSAVAAEYTSVILDKIWLSSKEHTTNFLGYKVKIIFYLFIYFLFAK